MVHRQNPPKYSLVIVINEYAKEPNYSIEGTIGSRTINNTYLDQKLKHDKDEHFTRNLSKPYMLNWSVIDNYSLYVLY